MNKDKKKMKKMTERILNHALQIIYLLTGEEYTIVKKNSPHSSIHLTGEVPIKCDDVAIYFSMEEWEYIDGHKEFYKDIMMCKHQTLQNLGTPANWDSDDEILDTASISDSRNEEKDVKHNQQVEIISAESNADIVLNTEQTEDLCVGDQLESLEHEIGDNNSTGMCNENICSLSVIKDDKDVKNIHQVETLPDVYPAGFHNVNLDPPSVIKGVNDEASFQHVETLPNIYADRFANWNMLEESSTTVCSSECTVKDHND
ncbi:uncharacterized protein O3C94_021555 [Discoglossus pictus]